MDEEQKELPPPPRYRYKIIKFMTLSLFFLVLFFSIGFTGLKATSNSSFCATCHEMKPEYYTWKASTHAEVDCVNCHTQAGTEAKNVATNKANIIADTVSHQPTDNGTPIQMTSDIQNSACEKCHNMATREVTPSGDIIIPHEKHMAKGIECTQCHSGVAHGKIADRRMTYPTDYDKWDSSLGNAAMTDLQYTRPDMDICMGCHKARNVSTSCKTCHKTGMVPKSHIDTFKAKTHGLLAQKNIKLCDSCHGYMSSTKITGLEEVSAIDIILNKNNSTNQTLSAFDYAKQNTFCKKCHSKRPASHTSKWIEDHHTEASKNTKQCLACHNYQAVGKYRTKAVSCSTCHPSIHTDFNGVGHPIPLKQNQKITSLCYTCHNKTTCSSCHRDS
jgi:nitrate/TMAO reductase-like tetraheme cytochrome c subunit